MHLRLFCVIFLGHSLMHGTLVSAGNPASPSSRNATAGNGRNNEAPTQAGADEIQCSNTTQCPNNSQCDHGVCMCNGGRLEKNSPCRKIPGFGEPCRFADEELPCVGFGVATFCSAEGTCKCKPGYGPDENKKNCRWRTPALNGPCESDGDCTKAFTFCRKGKCACVDGFFGHRESHACVPRATNLYCHGNRTVDSLHDICRATIDPVTGHTINDTCRDPDITCVLWQNADPGTSVYPVGHCCPKPKVATDPFCPFGLPHSKAVCNLNHDILTPEDMNATSDTPFCLAVDGYDCYDGLCCQSPCRSRFFNVAGNCYDHVGMFEPCKIDAQCLDGAICKDGTCQCKPGYTLRDDIECVRHGL